MKKSFLIYLKSSYHYAKKISILLDWIDIWEELKEAILFRLKNKDIKFTQEIIKDFWKWIDFSLEIDKALKYLRTEKFLQVARKIEETLK